MPEVEDEQHVAAAAVPAAVSDSASRWFGFLRRNSQFIWGVLSSAALILIVVAWGLHTPAAPDLDVGAQWNISIGRYGMLPVFPPTEDFIVGDIWATTPKPCWRAEDSGACQSGFMSSAIRIGHLDLSGSYNKYADLPLFDPTVAKADKEEYRKQDTDAKQAAPVDNNVHLTFVAFPDVSISEANDASSSGVWRYLPFNASGKSDHSESVSIIAPTTYGAPVSDAYLGLRNFCNDATNKVYCDDKIVRRLMAFALSNKICETFEPKKTGGDVKKAEDVADEVYKYAINIELIYRVYMSRQFNVKSSSAKSFAFDANTNTVAGAGDAPKSAAAKLQSAISVGEEGAFVSQRPLIFGYRSITLALPVSAPKDAGCSSTP